MPQTKPSSANDAPPAGTSDNFYILLLRGVLKKPWTVILLTALVTAVFGWHLSRITFRTSVYDMIVDSLPETARYRQFKDIFGSDEIIRVVLRSDENVFTPSVFGRLQHMSNQAKGIAGVRRVISLAEIKQAIELSNQWPLEKFEKVAAPVGLFKRNLISHDHKTTLLTLVLENDADKEWVIQAVAALIDALPAGMDAYQIGMPLVSRSMVQFTEKDFTRLPPLAFLLMAVILWLLFRSWIGLILPVATILTALCWTLGLMAWLDISLSMMTMIVPVFLIAVGTAYCLHIIATHSRACRQADSARQAVLITYRRMTLPTLLTISTTIVGLLSLLVNRIQAIHEFALFSCFGLISLLVILLSAFPAALVIFHSPRGATVPAAQSNALSGLLRTVAHLNIQHRKKVLSLVLVVSAIALTGVLAIRVETNPIEFFKADTAISRHFHDIYRDLSGSFPIYVVMDSGHYDHFERPEAMARIEGLQQHLETLPGIDKSVSMADYMKLVNYTTNQYDPAFYVLPTEAFEVRMLINQYKSLLGDDMLKRFVSSDFSKVNILLFTHLSSSHDFLNIKRRILAYTAAELPQDWTFEVTGFGMLAAASSHLLTNGQLKSFLLTMVFVFVMMLALFLSIKVGLIAILPNAFPILMNFGIMGIVGFHLSMVTSLVASIAIGLAVDDTIHYLYRYNHEFKKDLNKDRAMKDTVLHIGQPVLFTTITIGVGFSILLFSHFQPTSIFGLLIVITMAAALVGDLLILPILMLNVELVTAWDMLKLMPAMSGLSPNTAHELNQPLNTIKMGTEYLKMISQLEGRIPAADLSELAAEMGSQVDRAARLVRRLTHFAPVAGSNQESVDVNRAVKSAAELIQHQLHVDNIALYLELDDGCPPIYAHAARLNQVILNLITNASEAIVAKRGDRPAHGNAEWIRVKTASTKTQVVIDIEDTGIGIPAHLMDRIAEPFFTTKNPGIGKGLGLTVSKEIVKSAHGRMSFKSQMGQGTRVRIVLPPSGPPFRPPAAAPKT